MLSSNIDVHSLILDLGCDPIVYVTVLGWEQTPWEYLKEGNQVKRNEDTHCNQCLWTPCCDCLGLTPNKGVPARPVLRAYMETEH